MTGLPGAGAVRNTYKPSGRDNMSVDDIEGAVPRRLVGVMWS